MEIITALFFLIALCVGHRRIEGYSKPLKKKIFGWLLIVIAVLNLFWDIAIAIDSYNHIPTVDTELIKKRLANYRYVPRLDRLSPERRNDWEREQIIAGTIDSRTSYEQKECLFNNQVFIQMFGREMFYQYAYDQRVAMIEDSINRYNKAYIDRIFYECLSPFNNDGSFNPKKGLGASWKQYSYLTSDEKLRILENYVNKSNNSFEIHTPLDTVINKIRRAINVFFILLGWGIYILLSTKICSPIWKRVVKTILYILMSIVLFASASLNPFVRIGCLSAEFLLMIVLLALNLTGRYSNEDSKGTTETIEQYNWCSFFIKIGCSIVIPIVLILCCIWIKSDDVSPWLFFYFPYYLLILVYYEYVIWRKCRPFGAFLMVPILNKIGLSRNTDNQQVFKRNLLKTVMPAILSSIILPLIASLIFSVSDGDGEIICHVLLALPVLGWIVGLIYSYSLHWLNKQGE